MNLKFHLSFLCLQFALISCASTSETNPRALSREPSQESHGQSTDTKLANASKSEVSFYEKIDQLYRAKQFDAALQESQTFIKLYPTSSLLDQIYHFRGLSYIGKKEYQFA